MWSSKSKESMLKSKGWWVRFKGRGVCVCSVMLMGWSVLSSGLAVRSKGADVFMINNVQGVVGELKHGSWDQRWRSMCGGEIKRMVCSR